jgi:branched-chain amino acid transport system substrate-binding protein
MKKAISITLLLLFLAAGLVSVGCTKQEPAPTPPTEPTTPPATTVQPATTAAAAPTTPTPAPGATTPIKIGAILSVTGPQSSLGLPEKQTLEMEVEKINAAGGVNGRPLSIVIYDDEGDETKAVMFAQKLINEDKVKAILGPTISGTSMAILETVSNAQIPLISCAASYKIVTDEKGQARKWVFKTPQSDSMAVERIYEYLKKNNVNQVAIMSVSNGYGDSGRAELQRLAPNFAVTLVADEKFGNDDTDMTPQLTKIQKTDAQALIVWGTQKAPAIIAQNAKTLGLKLILVQSHGVASKKFIELAGDAANGEVLPAGKLIVAAQLPDTDPQKAVVTQYKTDYEAKTQSPVSTFGGHAYDALMILVEAMKKAGTDDPAAVRSALEQIQGFVGTGGVFNLSAADHNGLNKDAFVMIKIEGNDWKMIKE